ncbi:Auxin-responsive protein [Quillaja saponaria]|uniref:Auxin-responsive protein n=1 Tax=Quillaja saponaria TaxID=32244 RepID=A0AAD7PQ12_QUISA|nr:Auxin-responsive protein [Quillaja saponaria]
MDSKKSNKIRDIVRLQQILKKWKKLANAPKHTSSSSSTTSSNSSTTTNVSNSSSKSIKFLKRTLSFTDIVSSNSSNHDAAVVPKGFLAICVGKELKRFIIPTEYLGHQAFSILLREAEEEFGFQQEGVLKIPCDISVFEKILKMVEEKRQVFFLHENSITSNNNKDANTEIILDKIINGYSSSSDCELTPSHHPQMCR